jgi:NAD/NADP transhydrogenase alpha subunit
MLAALAEAEVTAFAMEAIPRISRAQSLDALSSQANVAGYKAALLAAEHATRFFPMLMTAAGTIPPAKVLVLGVGMAGLQALATSRRLGAQATGAPRSPSRCARSAPGGWTSGWRRPGRADTRASCQRPSARGSSRR